ncbi:tartrate dehydrogenase [Glutamicibacter sp. JL.03c]|uniref:tartrate dehydrogenase n=1 Tax=Glutamicibacter sp. JL.03c TaxID=2984842 RepID=UPI0021F6C93F|nr:tartrate dehydrogenase [Glutamicibacter sp. JL.03c]UYQ77750.1 tartrate dehydrogenase [Glutamicibacter sp. JL.03c]
MITKHRIAIIPGDGIGAEVIPPARAVLEAIGRRHALDFTFDELDWSCERYALEGSMMPADGLRRIRNHDAILLGAVGWPGVPDHESLWGLLIPIRQEFKQYINLRPIKVLDGVPTPLRSDIVKQGVDFVIVRENSQGEYSNLGGRLNSGGPDEIVIQESVFTRAGVTRAIDFALRTAASRNGTLTSATKSNAMVHSMTFWDEVFTERAIQHPDVSCSQEHVDALAAKLVMDPTRYDVIVASNLFGDILSDLAAGIAGSLGIAPSGNLNPEREYPSMFEPVHGSAPDIAGKGIANPLAAIWSAAMMVDHLGHHEASAEMLDAAFGVLADTPIRTRDLGGTASTVEYTNAVLDRIGVSAPA